VLGDSISSRFHYQEDEENMSAERLALRRRQLEYKQYRDEQLRQQRLEEQRRDAEVGWELNAMDYDFVTAANVPWSRDLSSDEGYF